TDLAIRCILPRMAKRPQRLSGWVGCLCLLVGQACRSPTQVRIEVTTDLPCTEVSGSGIAVGPSAEVVESRPSASVAATCTDGVIGTLVLSPSAGDGDEFAVRAVLASGGKSIDACVAPSYGPGCIVARRALRFSPHADLRLPIVLRESCDNVP